MALLTLWNILSVLSIICLLITFFIGKNAVWGTLTLGVIIAIVVLLIGKFRGVGYDWDLFKHIIVISVLAGALFEILGRLSKIKKK